MNVNSNTVQSVQSNLRRPQTPVCHVYRYSNKSAVSTARALVREVEGDVQASGHHPFSHYSLLPFYQWQGERWHRSLHEMMVKVVDSKQKRWVEFLPFATATYNSTVHGSTSFSPNILLFGRELVFSVDIAFGCPKSSSFTVNDFAFHRPQRMAEAYALVRQHMQRRAEVNKRAYNVAAEPVSFQPGDTVW